MFPRVRCGSTRPLFVLNRSPVRPLIAKRRNVTVNASISLVSSVSIPMDYYKLLSVTRQVAYGYMDHTDIKGMSTLAPYDPGSSSKHFPSQFSFFQFCNDPHVHSSPFMPSELPAGTPLRRHVSGCSAPRPRTRNTHPRPSPFGRAFWRRHAIHLATPMPSGRTMKCRAEAAAWCVYDGTLHPCRAAPKKHLLKKKKVKKLSRVPPRPSGPRHHAPPPAAQGPPAGRPGPDA